MHFFVLISLQTALIRCQDTDAYGAFSGYTGDFIHRSASYLIDTIKIPAVLSTGIFLRKHHSRFSVDPGVAASGLVGVCVALNKSWGCTT